VKTVEKTFPSLIFPAYYLLNFLLIICFFIHRAFDFYVKFSLSTHKKQMVHRILLIKFCLKKIKDNIN